jgi:hypothetical protein
LVVEDATAHDNPAYNGAFECCKKQVCKGKIKKAVFLSSWIFK